MPIITVKVEDALKDQAASVLDELGLDLPTAIRMYLKALVRENGVPISTKLTKNQNVAPAVPAAEEPAPVEEEAPVEEKEPAAVEEAEPEEEPAVVEEAKAAEPAVIIDYTTKNGRKAISKIFIDEICSVPEGKLTRWKDMEAKLSAAYGVEVTRPQSIRWPATKDDGTEIPYWRIVGDRGAVRGDKMIEQAVQEEKLKAEGHAFISAGHDRFAGIKVEDWKKKLN